MEEETSEFGSGFIYNLLLFAKHFERYHENLKNNNERAKERPDLWQHDKEDMWFNGAGDHFFELNVPPRYEGTEIERLALELQKEALERRIGKTTTPDEFAAFHEKLENLCRLIDVDLGAKSIKAEWN